MADGGCARCGFDAVVMLPAQPDPMTVTGKLRWEGDALLMGNLPIGRVRMRDAWEYYGEVGATRLTTSLRPTKAAARTALVEAVKESIGG